MIVGVGDNMRARATFKNNAVPPVVTDPTTVTVTINGPGTNVVTYTYGVGIQVVKESTGIYRVDFVAVVAGRWWIEWDGTGNVTASGSLNFLVNQGG